MFEALNGLTEQEKSSVLQVVSNLEMLRLTGNAPSSDQIIATINTLPEKLKKVALRAYGEQIQISIKTTKPEFQKK